MLQQAQFGKTTPRAYQCERAGANGRLTNTLRSGKVAKQTCAAKPIAPAGDRSPATYQLAARMTGVSTKTATVEPTRGASSRTRAVPSRKPIANTVTA